MANPTIGIDVTARLDSLQSELAKIGPLGGKAAKDMVAQLSREIKAATKPAKEAASALDSMGKSAGAVGGAAKKLRGGLDSLIPGMGSLLGVVDDVGDAFEVAAGAGANVGVGLGVLGLAIGAAAIAWQGLAGQEAEAAAVAKEVAAAHARVDSILQTGLADVIAYEVVTGALSETQGKLATNTDKATASLQAATGDTVTRIKELRTAQDSIKTQLVDLVGAYVQATDIFGITSDVYDGLTTSSADLADEQSRLQTEVNASAAAAKENKVVTDALIKAEEEAAAATRRRALAIANAIALVDALIRINQQLEDEDVARDKRNRARQEEAAKENKEADKDYLEAQKKKHKTQKEIDDETYKKNMEDIAEYKQGQKDRLGYARTIAQQTFDVVSQFADLEYNKRIDTMHALQQELADGEDTLTEHQKKALRRRIAAQKAAAKQAFVIEQAGRIASAIINTAAAVVQALGNLPPPYSYVAAGISAAAGAAEIAVIASQKPTFHAGGVMYADEGNARLLSGEGVLTRKATQAMGGSAAVAAMNAHPESAPAMSGGVTVIRIGRNEAREIVRTDIRANGLLPRTIDRRARTAGTEPGLSGRRVVA